jgi:hypothetical protein
VKTILGRPVLAPALAATGCAIAIAKKTLPALSPLHGFGIARRIGQVSRDILQLHGDPDHDLDHDPYR